MGCLYSKNSPDEQHHEEHNDDQEEHHDQGEPPPGEPAPESEGDEHNDGPPEMSCSDMVFP